jgi:cytochrome c oxidase subunit 2
MTEWLGLPALAAVNGGQIDSLIGWTHIFMFILFVGWGGFFTYCLFRFHRSRNPVADYKGVTSHTSTYLEGGVAIVEGQHAFVPFASCRRVAQLLSELVNVDLEQVARSIGVDVHYAGPDGQFGHTDINKIDLQSNPWDSIAPIRPPKTTSPPSISSTCRSTSRSS